MNKKAAFLIAAAAVVLLFAGIFCGAAAAAWQVTITFYNDDGTAIGDPQIVSDIPQNGTAKVVLLKETPCKDNPAQNKYFIGWEDRKNPGKYYTDRQALSLTRYSPGTLELKAVYGGLTTVVSSEDDYHITQNGYYQLKAGESEVTSPMHVSKGVLAVLDLNGVDVHWTSYASKRVVENEGTLMIRDSSQGGPGMITGGRYEDGAGIRVYKGASLTIERAVIENNAVDGKGGGIYVEDGGQVTMLEGAVIGPTGVYWGNNEARYGAGVYVEKGGIFTMAGGSIQKNCKYGSSRDKDGYGTGVYVAGTFNMLGGSISQNATNDYNEYWHGAGVYVADGGTFIMTGGTISGNGDPDDGAERKGAGVYISKGGEFVGTGGAVENNKGAETEGTGIYCEDGGRLYVSGTFSVKHNVEFVKEDLRLNGSDLVLMGPYTGTLNISSAPDALGGENYKTNYIPTAADLSHLISSDEKKVGIDTEYLSSATYYKLKKGTVHKVSFDWPYPGKPAEQTVIDGGHAAKPANPEGDPSHRFDKWYTDSKYTTPFDFANDIITDDTELYGRPSTVELIKYDGKTYNEDTIVKDGSPFAGCEYSPDSRILKITKEVIYLEKAVEIIAPGELDSVFTIDLNGHAISSNAVQDSVIKVTTGSALNITDTYPTSAQLFKKLPSGALEWLGPDATAGDVLLKGGIITGGTKSGVYVDSGARVTMFAGSIAGNKGDDLRGGGVYVGEKGSFILKGGAAVTGNESSSGGGVYVDSARESGTLIPGYLAVEGGEISNNVATSYGGGIFSRGGEVCIAGGAVSGNLAKNGGGITITRGNTLTLKGGVISGNSAEYNGGGVYMWSTADKFTMTGGKISANTALTGGGVYNLGSFVMEEGEISNNIANTASSNDEGGAGVYVAADSTFTLKNGSISKNVSNSFGGGVQCNGSFVMEGGKISENSAALGGGGVYVEESGTDNKGFTFNAGRILKNVVSSATGEVGAGGGICVYNGGKAVMRETASDAPKASGNKANYGGGVFVAGQNSSFTIESGWIGDPALPNHAGYGGGFYVQEGGRFTMTGGYVYGNWAEQKGGAGVVYAGGTVSISGGAVLETDKAGLLTSGISVASDGLLNPARFEISDKANVFQVYLADETPIYITGKFADGDKYGVSNITLKEGSTTGAVVAECDDETIAQSSLSHLKLNAAKYSDYALIVEGAKITLQRKVCTVTFINEGSIYKTEPVYYNTPVTKPDNPSSSKGLKFLGWYTSAGSAWDFTTPVISDMTLRAHYETDTPILVLFDANGGVFKGGKTTTKEVACTIGWPFGAIFDMLEVSNTGHTFVGWFTDPEGGRQVPYTEIVTKNSPRKLYAHWGQTPIKYKIEYNPGDGSGEKYYQDCTYGKEEHLLENKFTPKSGYKFAGWEVPGILELKQPGEMVINLATKEGAVVIVTAAWEATTHTVTFHSDGADPISISAETGSLISKPDDPEKPDYTFAGWYREEACVTPWDFDTDRMPDCDLDLYAKWTENPKYRVTYDLNEGSGTAPVDSVLHSAGSQVTVKDKTADMKRVGYTFTGWNGKRDGTGISYMPGHTFTITDNTTLYAKWVKDSEYNVSISDDGHGTASAAPSHAVAGATIRLTSSPYDGYKFDHWESSDVTVGPDNTFTMPAKNVTVKAFFREVPKVMYTVTYNINGGSGTPPAGGEYEAGADVLVKDKTADMKRDGYYFASWNSKPDGTGTTYRPGSTFEITGSITLYAEWVKENVYNITVSNDGHGTGSSDHGSAAAGTTIRLTSSPYDSYKFDHWESTDVTVGPDNTFVMPAKNVTVKACFTKAKYTVTYNVNGGSGTPPAGGEYEAGSLVTVEDKTSDMKKDGYYFGGWNSKPDGTGTTYRPGTTFKIAGNITLYAEWVKDSEYNITALNDGHGTASSNPGSAAAGTTIRLSYTPDTGYEFDHWESTDVTVAADNTFIMPAKDVTVKACFRELPKVMYTVTYNVNGGSGTPPAGGEYKAGSLVTVEDKTSDMKKDGYYFGGWNSKPDGTGTTYGPGSTFKLTGNITLYAEWVEESVYDISVLNDGHGTGSSDHGSAAAGATIRLTSSPYDGYKFDHWESADVTVGPDNTFVMPAKNVTVTAHFKELPKVMYTVIYDGNEATSGSAPDPATYETGTPVTVQGNTGGLARDGYTFSGWNTDRAGTGTDYQPGSTFVITGNITLYAEWTPVEKHSITIDIIGPGHATSDKPFAEKGETVHLYGSADPGYAMTDWRVYPSDLVIWEESETSLYFTMPDEDVYLYGFFGPAPGPTPTPTPKPTPHQGGSQGSSVWLTETPTPTPTPTGLPTPTAVPLATPTETPKSPVGIVGILAGLGAAAVLLRRK